MGFTDHDYSSAIQRFRIPSFPHLHDYYDLLTVFKTLTGLIRAPQLKNLFITRSLTYDIRLQRNLIESQYKLDFLHHSSIPRIIRKWNMLPSDIRSLDSVGLFKKKVKTHIYNF